MPTARLNSGYDIPLVGLGTWKSSPGQVRAAVLAAVRCGYRHIDCAAAYNNEHEIGAALEELLAEGVVTRDQLFITTKLWNSDHGNVEAALRRSLAALRLTYLDLYLIHWPVTGCSGPVLTPSTGETWAAMEGCVEAGLTRSIGVSNFSRAKLQQLLDSPQLKIRTAVLQIEAHPYWPNSALLSWAAAQGLHVTAYSPLGSPDSERLLNRPKHTAAAADAPAGSSSAAAAVEAPQLMQHPMVQEMARRHGKSGAQVLIRWALQRSTSVLPKSANPERIKANLDVLSWSLADADMAALSRLAEVAPQRMVDGSFWLSEQGPYKTLEDLWGEPQPDLQALRQQVLGRYTNLDKPQPTAQLSSGAVMPLLGLGTWKSEPGQVRAAVLAAVRCGYRHIDCAAIYGNEQEVGAALAELLAEGVVSRQQLFITGKLWNSSHGAKDVQPALNKTLLDLGLDYLDLFLIHWPVTGCSGPVLTPSTGETWAAMEACVEAGLTRSIGVSNFSRVKLQQLLDSPQLKIRPVVLQIEAHPYWSNSALLSWAAAQGLHVTAYSPLGSPDSAAIMQRGDDARRLLEEPALLRIAEQCGKSPAQVLIRWALQRGTSVLPKSANPGRIASNFDVLDWQLTPEDQQALSSLPYRQRMVSGVMWLNPRGPYKTLQDLWDEDEGGAE
ncbi:hypothetical protein OEZ85_007740 [Tetradesmus obliquus]|uniref:NADP-dependent oxidoreductase domain-containing protein n=1 Tax=Tetradesmus obliquus TaxID=3088 RepID=A0ABY8TIM4_TETOB|nr:hypothetical protein OEZ85_007740 [Tetradesmus obliquus]